MSHPFINQRDNKIAITLLVVLLCCLILSWRHRGYLYDFIFETIQRVISWFYDISRDILKASILWGIAMIGVFIVITQPPALLKELITTFIAMILAMIHQNMSLESFLQLLLALALFVPALLYLVVNIPLNFFRFYNNLPSNLNTVANRALLQKMTGKNLRELSKILKIFEAHDLAQQKYYLQLIDHSCLQQLLAVIDLIKKIGGSLNEGLVHKIMTMSEEQLKQYQTLLHRFMVRQWPASLNALFLNAFLDNKAEQCLCIISELQGINPALMTEKNIDALLRSSCQDKVIAGLRVLSQAQPRCDSQKNFEMLLTEPEKSLEKGVAIAQSLGAQLSTQVTITASHHNSKILQAQTPQSSGPSRSNTV